jgi:hypothetical protein
MENSLSKRRRSIPLPFVHWGGSEWEGERNKWVEMIKGLGENENSGCCWMEFCLESIPNRIKALQVKVRITRDSYLQPGCGHWKGHRKIAWHMVWLLSWGWERVGRQLWDVHLPKSERIDECVEPVKDRSFRRDGLYIWSCIWWMGRSQQREMLAVWSKN